MDIMTSYALGVFVFLAGYLMGRESNFRPGQIVKLNGRWHKVEYKEVKDK